MKKNILGLLILSSLPLFSTISNFNATKNIEAVIKQPIKKEATKIQEQYYLSQNPNDTNRPYEFEKAINSSQMVSKTSIKGSLEYTFSSNYIGYTNSFEGFIQINYKQNDDFWNANATYTLVYRGTMSLTKEGKYISVLSETKDNSGITTLRFCLVNLPGNNIKLFKFTQSQSTGSTIEKYNSALSKFNSLVAQGTNYLSTREIISFKRDSSYTLEDGGEATVYTNVDEHLTINQIISTISARDLFGESVQITIGENDYNANKVGTYRVPVTATDSYSQTASATIIVIVDDYEAPVITTKKVELNSDSPISFENFKKKLEVTDNYYSPEEITLTCVETSNGFSWDTNLIYGDYAVTIKATDKSNRSENYTISVKVNDAVAPTIKDLSGNVPTSPIRIGLSALNSDINSQIISLFKVEDDHDVGLEPTIKNGTVERKVGNYKIVLQADDTAGNHTELLVNIEVFADKVPVFILNPLFAISSPDRPLSSEDIEELIINSLPKNYSNLAIDEEDLNSYLQNSSIECENTIKFTYNDEDSNKKSSALIISVQKAPFSENNISPSFLSQLFNSWQTLFNNFNNMTITNWLFIILSSIFTAGIIALIYFIYKKINEKKEQKSNSNEEE